MLYITIFVIISLIRYTNKCEKKEFLRKQLILYVYVYTQQIYVYTYNV